MKKILSLLLCGMMIFMITGCGDSGDKNNDEKKSDNVKDNGSQVIEDEVKKEISLECSGDYLFNFGFVVGSGPITANGDETEIADYFFDDASGIGNGVYKFIFDDDGINKMVSTETMNLTYSKQITDSQIKEEDNSMEDCTIVRNNSGNIVIECEYDTESTFVKALNIDAKNPEVLKSILEEETDLVCR